MSPAVQDPSLLAGSLIPLVDELVALAHALNDTEALSDAEELSIFRWKPPRPPTRFPALWHWLTPDAPPPEQMDTNRLRDHISISAYIGMPHGDQDSDMAQLERYADAYRNLVDPALWKPEPRGVGPLNGTAKWAKRLSMRLVAVQFNAIECIAFEFPLEFDLDRPLAHP